MVQGTEQNQKAKISDSLRETKLDAVRENTESRAFLKIKNVAEV